MEIKSFIQIYGHQFDLFLQVLNISNVANWLGEKLEDRDGFIPKTMLSVPIFNGARDVIGVAQLINKVRIVNRRISHGIYGSAYMTYCR